MPGVLRPVSGWAYSADYVKKEGYRLYPTEPDGVCWNAEIGGM